MHHQIATMNRGRILAQHLQRRLDPPLQPAAMMTMPKVMVTVAGCQCQGRFSDQAFHIAVALQLPPTGHLDISTGPQRPTATRSTFEGKLRDFSPKFRLRIPTPPPSPGKNGLTQMHGNPLGPLRKVELLVDYM